MIPQLTGVMFIYTTKKRVAMQRNKSDVLKTFVKYLGFFNTSTPVYTMTYSVVLKK